MTDTEKIKRIEELLNDLDLIACTKEELKNKMVKDCTFKELIDGMWLLYCFASDVCDTLNM